MISHEENETKLPNTPSYKSTKYNPVFESDKKRKSQNTAAGGLGLVEVSGQAPFSTSFRRQLEDCSPERSSDSEKSSEVSSELGSHEIDENIEGSIRDDRLVTKENKKLTEESIAFTSQEEESSTPKCSSMAALNDPRPLS